MGRTVDLRAFQDGAWPTDGCPERVAKPIEPAMLPSGGTFEFEVLGAVHTETARDDGATDAFARRLARGLTVPDLAARLNSIIA